MIPYTWLETAAERLTGRIRETPLTYDPKHKLYLKWENRQITGSFKLRGALNKVISLQAWERERGLVAASAGNHGQGLAVAGSQLNAPVVIFASENAVPAKIEAMRNLGAEVRLTPGGYGEAELAGLVFATEKGATWVSPYNDGQVIAGQGTLALEVLRQALRDNPSPSGRLNWVVPAGGGGLCAGVACALFEGDSTRSNPNRLFAVQSAASPFFYAIFHQGSQNGQVELPSLADGLAGPVEENSVTIPILRRYVDDFVLVSEEDIQQAIAYAWQVYGETIEGSAAAALAAVLTGKIPERPAVVIISGGNIQPELHQRLRALPVKW